MISLFYNLEFRQAKFKCSRVSRLKNAIFSHMKTLHYCIALFCIATGLFSGCSTPTTSAKSDDESGSSSQVSNPSVNGKSIYDAVQETGKYTSKDSVAAYVCKFDKLPQNYVGKGEGQKLYESSTGNAFSKWNFNPWKTLGVMIGGDTFENREGLLPTGSYCEADVDYGNATSRGTKRLVYQSGCVIYYTADHYETFTQFNLHR